MNITPQAHRFVVLLALLMSITTANAQKLYWFNADPKGFFRSNLNGCAVEQITTDEGGHSLVIDSDAGKIYWLVVGEIKRSNIDFTQIETIFFQDENVTGARIKQIALDTVNQKLYWTLREGNCHNEVPSGVFRANLDGSNIEHVIPELCRAVGIDIDVIHKKYIGCLSKSLMM